MIEKCSVAGNPLPPRAGGDRPKASGIKHRNLLRNAFFGTSYEVGEENRHAKNR
jgi:hypothetical protein